MPENLVPVEDAADRSRFISRTIDLYLDTRTGSPEVMRNIGVAGYVGAELSQDNRRELSGEERAAVEAASASKLKARFGG